MADVPGECSVRATRKEDSCSIAREQPYAATVTDVFSIAFPIWKISEELSAGSYPALS
jgi:hypothetical protein